jgi:hypothetical protein
MGAIAEVGAVRGTPRRYARTAAGDALVAASR